MIKAFFWILFLIIFAGVIYLFYPVLIPSKTHPLLILNMQNEEVLPKHFRTTKDSLKTSPEQFPNLAGLANLNASGSAQFSQKALKLLLEKIPHPVVIVDLRQESHGFINGMAVSWYASHDWANIHKSLSEISQDELERLKEAFDQKYVFVYYNKKFPVLTSVNTVETEMESIIPLGTGYLRIPITDHRRPSDQNVDDFLTFVRSLPANTWLHFHCAAGEGRTTTLLAMYDMLHNGSQVSFEDIIKRQHLIGGIDLLSFENEPDWKQKFLKERADFLRQFYLYCSQKNPLFQETWSSWIASHNAEHETLVQPLPKQE